MKQDLLMEIAGAISADLANDCLTSTWHYYFNEVWRPVDKLAIEPTADIISALTKSKADAVAYHAPKSRLAWFYLHDVGAVVSVEFPSSPTIKTRQTYRKRIEEVQKNAVNAFKVSHNELTGLLSRDAFREKLRGYMDSLSKAKPKGFVLASEGLALNTVNVLAFDIDKFKQVNDTYGHIYGDQVLKAFAWRLEEAANKLKTDPELNIRVSLGHPSGEEFLALVEGHPNEEELRQIADVFRQTIADEPLPSEGEWKRLSASAELAKVPLPHKVERLITTSVGVATYTGSTPIDKSAPLALLDKADIALYKSKSGGRNRVTLFDEILQRCGRVLEYDANIGVIAIDIGSKVGVLIGQEFRVFPLMYSGQSALTVDDGRTRKTLGTYPKVELCRVVVFNVQSDVSFAYVANPSGSGKIIPQGALLEAVPLGNITHLIDHPNVLGNLSGFEYEVQHVFGGAELQDLVEQLIQSEKRPFAAILRFRRENDFYKKYGSAALNRAIARLFSGIRAKFTDGQKVGMIDKTAICIVGELTSFDVASISALFDELHPTGDELEPICGYYPSKDSSEKHELMLDKHAIELARYALSDIADSDKRKVEAFSIVTAESVLAHHRASRSNAAGVADYMRLKEIGIRSAQFENTGGLMYSALGDNSSALECYQRALELKPGNTIYRGNVAIIAKRMGQIDLGIRVLSEIGNEKLEQLKNIQPNAIWTYATLLLEAKKSGSSLYTPKLLREIGSIACSIPDATSRQEYSELQATLASLSLP